MMALPRPRGRAHGRLNWLSGGTGEKTSPLWHKLCTEGQERDSGSESYALGKETADN